MAGAALHAHECRRAGPDESAPGALPATVHQMAGTNTKWMSWLSGLEW